LDGTFLYEPFIGHIDGRLCGHRYLRKHAGGYIDNSAITTKVKAMIYDDPELKAGQISVETYEGVVQLSGFVNSA
jgi:osmotically-inducible protein OsmY